MHVKNLPKPRELTESEKQDWKNFVNNVQKFKPKVVLTATVPEPVKPVTTIQSVTSCDLHGQTLGAAHRQVVSIIGNRPKTTREILFITGKSGDIRREFPYWIENLPGIRSVESVSGGGAYMVKFLKKSR